MKNRNGKGRATNATGGKLLCVPPLEPQKILLWFTLLEVQFELASITSDKLKFNTLIANLGYQYLKLVVDIAFDPPATGRYEMLKSELIKKLADSNDTKVWKLLEAQKIEDRTPSQFYRDLKRLANTLISDDLVLMLWKTRLPLSMQRALDVVKEMGENVLTEIADRIHEIWLETERITAVSAERTTEVGKQSDHASDTLHDRVSRLEAQTSALILDNRPRSPSERHKLQSREKLQQPGGLSYYHGTFSDCANNCYYPGNANQNQENATQPSVITAYDIDKSWGLIYVKDTASEFPFLVDTGAVRCTFPRKYIRSYANRARDENCYMIAANGTRIDTYGPIPVYLNLGSKWRFEWQFTVADVISPVIGMDFLKHHGFLVDIRNKCLFKPAEPAYDILCYGCYWGLDVPHKPNPSAANPLADISDLPRPSGFGRGRLLRDAKPRSDTRVGSLDLIKPGCIHVDPQKRKGRIQGDDGARTIIPFKLDDYFRIDSMKDDELYEY